MKNAMIKRLAAKSKENKGFTLIEVIVVLVILAILAAIAIPALTGYIDKASQRAVISEAHNAQVALQALAVDKYADGTSAAGVESYFDDTAKLAEIQAAIDDLTGGNFGNKVTVIDFDGTTLTGFTYISGDIEVEYTSTGGYEVVPNP
jgi:type IV pilus assembly protein PilA